MKFSVVRKQARNQKRAERRSRSPYPEMDAMTSTQLSEFMNSDEITIEQHVYGQKLLRAAARA